MATVYQEFAVADLQAGTSNIPPTVKNAGTNFPIMARAFDAAADEACYGQFIATRYGSGNLTVEVFWYADSASSGDVVFGFSLAAITPNTDSQDVETDSLTTENTVTDSHIGTTGQRVHSASITVSNLDSLADGDAVFFRFRRVGSNGSDTMTGDAFVTLLRISYSDT